MSPSDRDVPTCALMPTPPIATAMAPAEWVTETPASSPSASLPVDTARMPSRPVVAAEVMAPLLVIVTAPAEPVS